MVRGGWRHVYCEKATLCVAEDNIHSQILPLAGGLPSILISSDGNSPMEYLFHSYPIHPDKHVVQFQGRHPLRLAILQT